MYNLSPAIYICTPSYLLPAYLLQTPTQGDLCLLNTQCTSRLSDRVSSLDKASTFNHSSESTAIDRFYPITLTRLGPTCSRIFWHIPTVLQVGITSPARNHFPDKLTIGNWDSDLGFTCGKQADMCMMEIFYIYVYINKCTTTHEQLNFSKVV